LREKIEKLIEEHRGIGHFSYSFPTDDLLEGAEQELKLKIPDGYKWFLKKYGDGGLGGVDIFGVDRLNNLTFVDETKGYRRYGMPQHLLAIENCDEWVFCIDTINKTVVMWFQGENTSGARYNTFCEYLYERLSDIIENTI